MPLLDVLVSKHLLRPVLLLQLLAQGLGDRRAGRIVRRNAAVVARAEGRVAQPEVCGA